MPPGDWEARLWTWNGLFHQRQVLWQTGFISNEAPRMRPNGNHNKETLLTQPQCVRAIAQIGLGSSSNLSGHNRTTQARMDLFVTPHIVETTQGHMGAI